MIDLERLKRIKRIATRRYNKAKKVKDSWTAMDRINYLSAKLTSTALLEAIEKWDLKPSDIEYNYWLESYDRMFKK